MCMPHPSAPETYITELDKDPAFTNTLMSMRKFSGSVPGNKIISPPPVEEAERPIKPEDTCILDVGLGRFFKTEQMQVETNKLTSSLYGAIRRYNF